MKIYVTHEHSRNVSTDYRIVPLVELEGIEPSSCLEVDINDTADYIPFKEREELYKLAVSKLRYGGKLVMKGNDLYRLGQIIAGGRLSIPVANIGLFSGRLSADTMMSVLAQLKELSIQADKYYYDHELIYSIQGTRVQ